MKKLAVILLSAAVCGMLCGCGAPATKASKTREAEVQEPAQEIQVQETPPVQVEVNIVGELPPIPGVRRFLQSAANDVSVDISPDGGVRITITLPHTPVYPVPYVHGSHQSSAYTYPSPVSTATLS